MIPLLKKMSKGKSGPNLKPNKSLEVMNPPSAPNLPKAITSFRIKADVDMTVKALYPLSKSDMWTALYDWVDSNPGQVSSRPILTVLLMWTALEAEQVGQTVWKSSSSMVLGFNDSVNPFTSVQQLTWTPVVGTGRTRISVTVKFLIKPSNRPGVAASDVWKLLMEDSDAVKFAEENRLEVTSASEAAYGDFM